MRFDCLENSYDLLADLRAPLGKIRRADPKLYQQLRSASTSIAMNVAEGRGRVGKDRTHHWRIALGSAEEVRAILRVAEALGDLAASDATKARERLDKIVPMLWKMTH